MSQSGLTPEQREKISKEIDALLESNGGAYNRGLDLAEQVARLAKFAEAALSNWPDGDWECGDMQEAAVAHGLLEGREIVPPCGEPCWCAEFHGDDAGPVTCYRRSKWFNVLLSPPSAPEKGEGRG